MAAAKPTQEKTTKRRAAPSASAAKPAARKRATAKPKPAVVVISPEVAETPPRRRRVRVAAAAAVIIVLVVAAASLVVLSTHSKPQRPPSVRAGVPTKVSSAELHAFGGAIGHAVYWIGSVPGEKLELTETKGGYVYVRYLPKTAVIGDKHPAFTTIATFPIRLAFASATSAAHHPNMQSLHVRGGGIAVWNTTRPTSVYVAYPSSGALVEIYDPDPARARALATSSVRPVVQH